MGKHRIWTAEEYALIERAYVMESTWYNGKWDEVAERIGITKAKLKAHVDYMRKKGILDKSQHKKIFSH